MVHGSEHKELAPNQFSKHIRVRRCSWCWSRRLLLSSCAFAPGALQVAAFVSPCCPFSPPGPSCELPLASTLVSSGVGLARVSGDGVLPSVPYLIDSVANDAACLVKGLLEFWVGHVGQLGWAHHNYGCWHAQSSNRLRPKSGLCIPGYGKAGRRIYGIGHCISFPPVLFISGFRICGENLGVKWNGAWQENTKTGDRGQTMAFWETDGSSTAIRALGGDQTRTQTNPGFCLCLLRNRHLRGFNLCDDYLLWDL